MNNYLAIDYGAKHLGFAIGETMLATPVGTLSYKKITSAYSYLSKLIKTHGITHVVIGIPEGKIADSVRRFGTAIEKEFSLPVIYHPETLSTQEAKSALIATGTRAKRAHDHAYAACLILEDYLDMLNLNK